MLQVQQAMLREINNKAKLSPAELELGLSLAKLALRGKPEQKMLIYCVGTLWYVDKIKFEVCNGRRIMTSWDFK